MCKHEHYVVVEDHQYEHRLKCRCEECDEIFWIEREPEHATIGLYFPLPQTAANALRARINGLAQGLGYNTAASLLMAIDRGDVVLIMIAPEEILRAISVLDAMPMHDDWPQSIVRALRRAIERGREADARDPDGYRAYLEAKKASLQTGNISPDWEG